MCGGVSVSVNMWCGGVSLNMWCGGVSGSVIV